MGRQELHDGADYPNVVLLPVQPWNFTVPLNASVIYARTLGASKIVFISLEMPVTAVQLRQIMRIWTNGMYKSS